MIFCVLSVKTNQSFAVVLKSPSSEKAGNKRSDDGGGEEDEAGLEGQMEEGVSSVFANPTPPPHPDQA